MAVAGALVIVNGGAQASSAAPTARSESMSLARLSMDDLRPEGCARCGIFPSLDHITSSYEEFATTDTTGAAAYFSHGERAYAHRAGRGADMVDAKPQQVVGVFDPPQG